LRGARRSNDEEHNAPQAGRLNGRASALRLDHIEHDPGAPPHRPHDGAADDDADDDFPPDSAPTANTLSARTVFGEEHVGHFGLTSLLIERCNCSNFAPQPWHVYS
jgi:hypothetical protein